ncbi:ribonuclease P [Pigmentiphaga humi]|uniref:Ribonuclease P n=1 Tax=Pigmentiphaga humi TaxID=2478468 RepID=A0A3P4AZU5_9BURK|nr:ribonuclease P [Pigmentiphaga humi]
MVVGKRFAPLSVSRGALKRVAREAFRLRRAELPAADYVLRLHARIPACSLTELKRQARQEINAHLGRAIKAWRPAPVPEQAGNGQSG